jgi:hypothetical protein
MEIEYCLASIGRLGMPYAVGHAPSDTGYRQAARPPLTAPMDTCVALPSTLKASQ